MSEESVDYKEYARQMRENCVKNADGNIICSGELWEEIATIIELLNAAVKRTAGGDCDARPQDRIWKGYRCGK